VNQLHALVVGCVLAWSTSSSAQVAVALTLPDPDPAHRDLAAGLVGAVAERVELLAPALPLNDVVVCAGELACLKQLATKHGASHLLVVGVAGLGTREAAVSVQVLDAAGKVLLEDNAVVAGSDVPRDDGAALASKVLQIPSLPPRLEHPVRDIDRGNGVFGASLLGAGVVVGAGSWIGGSLVADSDPDVGLITTIAGVSAGVVLAAVGTVLVIAGE